MKTDVVLWFLAIHAMSLVSSHKITFKKITVTTDSGPVQGIQKTSILGRDYFSFQSIPYMKAPVGKLRFRDPQPPAKWFTPLDATKEPPSYPCFDSFSGQLVGQEDAAVINVYTPYLNPMRKLPVLVWIHGGSFHEFSSKTDLFGPDYLLQKDVIVVTFNYRYGTHGFLSLKDPKLNIPGNAGLKDQVFALKWVQKNIANFGGDCGIVTLFGESAGAAAVNLHMLSDQSKGLFKRAIAMSGSALDPWTFPPITNYAERLAKQMGFNGSTEAQMLDFFEKKGPFDFIIAKNYILSQEEKYGLLLDVTVGPVVEPAWSRNPFFSKDPVVAARSAWSNDIDFIIGATSYEGLFQAYKEYADNIDLYIETFNSNVAYFAPLINLKLNSSSPKAKVYGQKIKDLYFGVSNEFARNNLDQFYRFIGDYAFILGNYRSVQSRLQNGDGKTFMYRFEGDTSLNFYKHFVARKANPGATHADDLFYIFRNIYTQPPKIASIEHILMKTMIDFITSFAISGTPTIQQEPIWNAVTKADNPPKLLNIANDGVSMMPMPEYENIKIFNEIHQDAGVDLI